MTTKLEAAAQQAAARLDVAAEFLDAVHCHPYTTWNCRATIDDCRADAAALREALAEQQAAEPVDADRARFIIAHLCNTFPELAHCHPARQPQAAEPVACVIGARGSAFDLPGTKRAYTYKEQPGNAVASKLGRACEAASRQSAGDGIDRGLGLLQQLQNEGFGVFDLGAEYTIQAPTQQPLTDEQIGEIGRSHEKFDKAGNEWFDRWAFARAIEAAHGIAAPATIPAPQLEAAQALIDHQAEKTWTDPHADERQWADDVPARIWRNK